MSTSISDVIALNRESKVHLPEFRLPVLPAIDEPYCSAWGRELGRLATAWECRKATPDLWHQIPAVAGLYMFVWKIPVGFALEGKDQHFFRFMVYCGQAGAGSSRNTLRDRYKNEYSRYLRGDPAELFDTAAVSGRAASLSRWLLLHPLEYWWAEVKDTTKLAGLEKELIRILAPPLNDKLKILRPGARRSAF